jgi:crossover junction endodeoxyribonuclease RuvC
MIVIGLDPGLQATGWGIIAADGNRLRHVANGTVRSKAADPLADRLVQLYDALAGIIAEHRPAAAAVEETFVNTNPQSTLKLGQARGVVMLVAAKAGLPVAEYAARFVKKAIVGVGAADKVQVAAMVARLLPGCGTLGPDAADALAVAITHAHMAGSARRLPSSSGEGPVGPSMAMRR